MTRGNARPADPAPGTRPAQATARRGVLYRNGLALVVNSGVSSLLGSAYWILAARTATPATVGAATALVAALTALSTLAQFSFGGAFATFLPGAGASARRLVLIGYGVATGASLLLGTVFVLVIPRMSPALAVLGRPSAAIGFTLAVVLWSIFSLQDSVLTGLRAALWVPIENVAYSATKLAVLAALAAGGQSGALSLFGSWALPPVVFIAAVSWLLWTRLLPPSRPTGGRAAGETLGGTTEMFRFLSGDAVGMLFAQVATTFLPVLVVVRMGSTAGGAFGIAWMLTVSVDLITIGMGISLTVEGAQPGANVDALHTAVLRRVLPVVAAVGAAGIAAAPAILKIFGTTYAEQATTLLRLLLLGGMARAVTVLAVCAARARRQAGRIVVLQAIPAMIITVGVWQFAQPLGLPGVGLAWVAGQSVTAMIAIMLSRPALRVRLNSGHNTSNHNGGGHNDGGHNDGGHNSDVAVPASVTAESITTEKRGAFMRMAGRDRAWIGRRHIMLAGPADMPDVAAVRVAAEQLFTMKPGHRLFRTLDPSSTRWRPTPTAEIRRHCVTMIVPMDDPDPDDLTGHIERLYASAVPTLPFQLYVGRRYAALSIAHCLGDGWLSTNAFPDLLRAGLDGDPPVALTRDETVLPLLRALIHFCGRDPRRLLAMLRGPRPSGPPAAPPRSRRAAGGPPPASTARAPAATSTTTTSTAATSTAAPSRPAAPALAVVARHSPVSTLADIREWRDAHAPGSTSAAVMFAAARVAFDRCGLGTPASAGLFTLVDNRRFLPADANVAGNFAVGLRMFPVDPVDPVAISRALRETVASGRPLATLCLIAARGYRRRLPSAAPPRAGVHPPPHPCLVLNHLGRVPRFERLGWVDGPPGTDPGTDTPQLYSASTPGDNDVISVKFVELRGALSITAAFHPASFSRAAVAAAIGLLCTDPLDLLTSPGPAGTG
ncbi:hypothetical protein, partial [Frankia sp. CIT1]